MGIGTRIGTNGVNQIDGSSGCQVASHSNNFGFAPFKMETSGTVATGQSQVGTAFTLTSPGFYWVSGSTAATGTLPAPGSFPGAHFMLKECNNAFSFVLTGSARTESGAVFTRNGAGLGSVSGSTVSGGALIVSSGFGASLARGDKLTVPRGGSVCLWSDGGTYVVQASSGSLQIEA
jgi:hypothetical protein